MKSIMLYNHGGCENRGCEAIVRATSEMFADRARVRMTSDTPEFDRAARLDAIDRIVSSEIAPYSIHRLVNSIGFRLGIPREDEVARKHHTVVSLGKHSSVCLSVGGDTYCYGHQEHLQVINKRLRRAGKTLVLWGCSVDPELIAGQTLEDLKAYQLIVARESITANAMKAAGLPVVRFCDPAFFLKSSELPLPSSWKEGGTVGLNVSPLILARAKEPKAAFDAFVRLIEHILVSGEDNVALIPHVTWPHDNDMDTLRLLKARFEKEQRVFILPDTLNAMAYKGYIRRLKALVTARTHASIAAYSTAVPTLVIGYSVKARGIAHDLFGTQEGHLIPVQELMEAEQLIAAFDALLAREREERSYLQKKLPAYMDGRDAVVGRILTLHGNTEDEA